MVTKSNTIIRVQLWIVQVTLNSSQYEDNNKPLSGKIFSLNDVMQRFPNILGCGPLLLLNIFRGPPGGLANTKDI